mgnify:CR=1 FL=1
MKNKVSHIIVQAYSQKQLSAIQETALLWANGFIRDPALHILELAPINYTRGYDAILGRVRKAYFENERFLAGNDMNALLSGMSRDIESINSIKWGKSTTISMDTMARLLPILDGYVEFCAGRIFEGLTKTLLCVVNDYGIIEHRSGVTPFNKAAYVETLDVKNEMFPDLSNNDCYKLIDGRISRATVDVFDFVVVVEDALAERSSEYFSFSDPLCKYKYGCERSFSIKLIMN